MKQRLKRQSWWSLSVIVTMVSLNLGIEEAKAQPLPCANFVLLSETTSNSSTPTISAQEIFRRAYENRYTWDSQFPGYTAVVEFKQGKEDHKGNVRVNSDKSVEVTGIDNKDARQTIEDTLRMQIVHHQRIPFEAAHRNSIFQMGATESTGAVEIFEHGDKTESHYKVFHQQLRQVNRLLGNTAVTVDVLNSETTPKGYLATHYRTIFHQPQTQQVLGEEESEDTYKNIGGYYVLARQVTHDSQPGQQTTASFDFSNIHLFSGTGG